MIRKLLIANRGEIAARIIRTCRSLGIRTVAVYSDADARADYVLQADEAVHIGAAPAPQSYLNIDAILRAARHTHADAIHPGYGFLSERAHFAQAVIDAGLTWIGPSPEVITLMGDKRRAKLALKAIPLVPGYNGDDQENAIFHAEAEAIGYPVMVKAAAGGGGRGMRIVTSASTLEDALEGARHEALQAFGDSTLLLEKYIERPRHIEVQILGDAAGHVAALGERECSIQRRHQKIIEETPSPALTSIQREAICAAAVSIGQQIGYLNAGTVEFILDQAGNFYFLEMNTRLQVEHPVTEAAFNIDLVEWQIRIAEGAPLPAEGFPSQAQRHAIEARLYAEDPSSGFLPSTGAILRAKLGDTVRIDAGLGDEVSTYYDPMLAKLIASAPTRAEAIRKLDYALSQITLLGIRHNAGFLRRVIAYSDFQSGSFDTGFIERHADLLPDPPPPPHVWIAAAIAKLKLDGAGIFWRNNPYRPIRQTFAINTLEQSVFLTPHTPDQFSISVEDQHFTVRTFPDQPEWLEIDAVRHYLPVANLDDAWWVQTPEAIYALNWVSPLPAGISQSSSQGSLLSPMPGQIVKILVKTGQQVNKGDLLLVIEAMKMEHRITAPYDGQVAALHFEAGQPVQSGVKLLDLMPSE